MVDSLAVFPAGFRATDSTDGSPLSGAVIRFYDAGTTTPKIVYADADLTTELGTSVTTDSLGYPTSNGTTKTQIYVGTASYKIRIETSTGAEIVTHDNVKGAVVSDDGSSSAAVTALFPVVTKSLDYTVLAADQNKLIAVNCSSGDVILTLPSAVTVGNGWGILVQHAGSANQAVLASVSSQTISEGSKSFGTTFALGLNGEECWIISDGGNWRVTSHTTPFPKVNPIPVIDRVTAAPGTPVEGGYYLVTSAYSTFSTHDIIQYTDNGYVAFSPYTDCGWIAYVADEDLNYQFVGSSWQTMASGVTALTADTNPDSTNDYVLSYDASGSAAAKVLHANLPGALLGLLEDLQTANTAPGNATASAWTTRTLNTETYDRLGIISISSNQFTISAAGTYEIFFESPFFTSAGKARARLYNVTDAAEVQVGTGGGWGGGTGATMWYSQGIARVTIAGSKTFRIEYWATSTSVDLGVVSNINSKSEIYTRVVIRRG